MTSILVRSGMPQHFGIRIIEADKDKLVERFRVVDMLYQDVQSARYVV